MSDHDNDTSPHLVRASLLEAENTRLKADAQLVVKHLGEACADNLRLKADVVELADALKLASEVGIKVADEVTRLKAENARLRASSFVTAVPVEQYERLKAKVDRLRQEVENADRESMSDEYHLNNQTGIINELLTHKEQMQGKIDRLTKAGDFLAFHYISLGRKFFPEDPLPSSIADWNAAKEGKPSV